MECWNNRGDLAAPGPDRAQGGSRGPVETHLTAVRGVDAAQDGNQGGLTPARSGRPSPGKRPGHRVRSTPRNACVLPNCL